MDADLTDLEERAREEPGDATFFEGRRLLSVREEALLPLGSTHYYQSIMGICSSY